MSAAIGSVTSSPPDFCDVQDDRKVGRDLVDRPAGLVQKLARTRDRDRREAGRRSGSSFALRDERVRSSSADAAVFAITAERVCLRISRKTSGAGTIAAAAATPTIARRVATTRAACRHRLHSPFDAGGSGRGAITKRYFDITPPPRTDEAEAIDQDPFCLAAFFRASGPTPNVEGSGLNGWIIRRREHRSARRCDPHPRRLLRIVYVGQLPEAESVEVVAAGFSGDSPDKAVDAASRIRVSKSFPFVASVIAISAIVFGLTEPASSSSLAYRVDRLSPLCEACFELSSALNGRG